MERVNILIGRVTGGKVEIQDGTEYIPADDVIILGQGEMNSEGFVLIGETYSHYITNTQVDAAFMLAKMIELCDQISAIGNTQTFAIPSVGVAPNTDLVLIAQQVDLIKTEIEGHKLV